MGSLNPENDEKQDLNDSGYVQEDGAGKKEVAEEGHFSTNLLDLSDDVLLLIFQYCKPLDLKALGYTCVRLSSLVLDRTLWRRVDTRAVPTGKRRMRWLLTHALSAHTTSLQVTGYAREANGCLGFMGGSRDGKFVTPLYSTSETPTPQWGPEIEPQPRLRNLCERALPRYVIDKSQKSDPRSSDSCPGPQLTFTQRAMIRLRTLCPNLTELSLEFAVIDCNMTKIYMFPPSLKKLSLMGTKCFNLGKQFLSKIQNHLVNLEELDVSECDWVEPAIMLPISKLARLTRLHMRYCSRLTEFVAYASLATRYGFRMLQMLDLRGTPVGDSEVSALGWLPRLEELLLSPAPGVASRAAHAHCSADPTPPHVELLPWEEQEPDCYRLKYETESWIRAEADRTPLNRYMEQYGDSDISSCVLFHHMCTLGLNPQLDHEPIPTGSVERVNNWGRITRAQMDVYPKDDVAVAEEPTEPNKTEESSKTLEQSRKRKTEGEHSVPMKHAKDDTDDNDNKNAKNNDRDAKKDVKKPNKKVSMNFLTDEQISSIQQQMSAMDKAKPNTSNMSTNEPTCSYNEPTYANNKPSSSKCDPSSFKNEPSSSKNEPTSSDDPTLADDSIISINKSYLERISKDPSLDMDIASDKDNTGNASRVLKKKKNVKNPFELDDDAFMNDISDLDDDDDDDDDDGSPQAKRCRLNAGAAKTDEKVSNGESKKSTNEVTTNAQTSRDDQNNSSNSNPSNLNDQPISSRLNDEPNQSSSSNNEPNVPTASRQNEPSTSRQNEASTSRQNDLDQPPLAKKIPKKDPSALGSNERNNSNREPNNEQNVSNNERNASEPSGSQSNEEAASVKLANEKADEVGLPPILRRLIPRTHDSEPSTSKQYPPSEPNPETPRNETQEENRNPQRYVRFRLNQPPVFINANDEIKNDDPIQIDRNRQPNQEGRESGGNQQGANADNVAFDGNGRYRNPSAVVLACRNFSPVVIEGNEARNEPAVIIGCGANHVSHACSTHMSRQGNVNNFGCGHNQPNVGNGNQQEGRNNQDVYGRASYHDDNHNIHNNNNAQQPDWNNRMDSNADGQRQPSTARFCPNPEPPRQRILYVNVTRPRSYRVALPSPVELNSPIEIYNTGVTTRLDYTSLVTDAAIRRFGRDDSEVNYIQIGPHGLRPAPYNDLHARPNISSLRVLSMIGYRNITNSSMLHLMTAAPHLQFIDVRGTRVTQMGVDALKSVRPDCDVRHGPLVQEYESDSS